MKISVSISPIWREYPLGEIEIYRALKGCGFDYADYDFCAANAQGWMKGDAAAWGREMGCAMENEGIKAVSAHIDGAQDDEAVKRAVRCAGAMGIKNVVVPLRCTPNNSRREYEQSNQAYLRALLPVAADAGVTLLIENCGSWLLPHYMHHAIELNRMMEKLGMPENLKVSLNIANLTVADIRPYTDIRLLGKAIYHVDAADNFGSMPLAVHPEREQLGFAPMMGYTNYDAVVQGLCEAGYDGFFNLRMNMPRVFDKKSEYCETKLAMMPQTLTARLHVWSRHVAEHMLRTYGCLEK